MFHGDVERTDFGGQGQIGRSGDFQLVGSDHATQRDATLGRTQCDSTVGTDGQRRYDDQTAASDAGTGGQADRGVVDAGRQVDDGQRTTGGEGETTLAAIRHDQDVIAIDRQGARGIVIDRRSAGRKRFIGGDSGQAQHIVGDRRGHRCVGLCIDLRDDITEDHVPGVADHRAGIGARGVRMGTDGHGIADRIDRRGRERQRAQLRAVDTGCDLRRCAIVQDAVRYGLTTGFSHLHVIQRERCVDHVCDQYQCTRIIWIDRSGDAFRGLDLACQVIQYRGEVCGDRRAAARAGTADLGAVDVTVHGHRIRHAIFQRVDAARILEADMLDLLGIRSRVLGWHSRVGQYGFKRRHRHGIHRERHVRGRTQYLDGIGVGGIDCCSQLGIGLDQRRQAGQHRSPVGRHRDMLRGRADFAGARRFGQSTVRRIVDGIAQAVRQRGERIGAGHIGSGDHVGVSIDIDTERDIVTGRDDQTRQRHQTAVAGTWSSS